MQFVVSMMFANDQLSICIKIIKRSHNLNYTFANYEWGSWQKADQMKSWQEDHLNALLRMKDESELMTRLAHSARQMGFDYCAYGAQMPVPFICPTVTLINTYPASWKSRYALQNYLEVDPIVAYGRRSCLPVVWSEQLFKDVPTFWEEAQSHGLKGGWSKSVRDAQGTLGMLSMARDGAALGANEIFSKNARLSWLSDFAHVGMMQLLLPKQVPESQIILTDRELEVLRWTAEGKTAFEIGHILRVSERTINFHINNIVQKLGACNKTQAAVKAVTLGMLI